MKKRLLISFILLSGICAHAQTWNIGYPNAADVVATLSNDTLYVRGTGDMAAIATPSPWQGSGITHAVIESGVTKIGNGAFLNCAYLTSVDITEDVTSIPDQTFMQCYNLASVTIPESVTRIGSSAFSGCRALTTIEIPENVTTIGNYAFTSSGIASITIPRSVTTIGDYIISNCISLNAVTNLNPVPQSVTHLSLSPPLGNMTLIVPCGSLTAYQNAPVWQDFGTIVEDCPKAGVSNVKANFACPGGVMVSYDLGTTDPVDVTLYYSPDNGKTWLTAQTVTGDLTAQTSGAGKTIVWDNRADKVRLGKFRLKVEVPKAPAPECVEINGVCWAKYNVDAPGTFVQNPEDAGMFYQWNRNVGWSSINPMINSNGGTVWDSSGAAGIEWEAQNNPCPNGFRVPTQAETKSLIDAGGMWATQNGVNGYLFGSGNNTIFLPLANSRRNDNGLLRDLPSITGYYWTSSTWGGGSSGNALIFFNVNPLTVANSSFSKPFGMSVRCVKE